MKLARGFFFFLSFFLGLAFKLKKNGRENEKSSKEQHVFFNGEEKEGRRSQMTGCAVCVFGGGRMLEVGRVRTPEQEASGKRQSRG